MPVTWPSPGALLLALSFLAWGPGTEAMPGTLPPWEGPLDWWQTSVIYQVYVRSFKDSNGDGIGDLRGVIEMAPYINSLGVKVVWLSPFFKSPMADFGYDISDYIAVDPVYGTLEDFEALVETLKKYGIRVILDMVPNHTSDQHEWFHKSVASVEPYKNYYIWHEGRTLPNGTRVAPNNWRSTFYGTDGTMWTWNEKRQAYYLHQYLIQQPDLDYRNPLVLREFINVLRFWLDHGAVGFRFDTIFTLDEDRRFLNEPRSFLVGVGEDSADYLKHIYTRDQPVNYDVTYAFRDLLDSYTVEARASGGDPSTRFMIVEASSPIEKVMLYYGNATRRGAHFPFNFNLIYLIDREATAEDYKNVIELWYRNMPQGQWANWVLGNHDQRRVVSRLGREWLDSLTIIQMTLPTATPIYYNGDELAMEDGFVRWSEAKDAQGILAGRENFQNRSRDPQRCPLQWDASISAGFSTARQTWLPVDPEYYFLNAAAESVIPKSHLSVFKAIVRLRSLPVLQRGSGAVSAHGDILVIERTLAACSLVSLLHTGDFYLTFDARVLGLSPEEWRVAVSTLNSEYREGEVVQLSELNFRQKSGVILINDACLKTLTGGYNDEYGLGRNDIF